MIRGEPDEQLGAAARHEHPGPDGDPQPRELCPPEKVLEGLASCAPGHEPTQLVPVRRGLDQERGLVLCEDAPDRSQPPRDPDEC
ncbi:hypothetical protein SCMU_03490 [Sinomonas cyclohexanicum]|uniref:Uncharacterized protein n=1 Tax=Sinomonas cyclohexanicum TaxID=322009 RepID=A0ABM7PR27_SINCY|nr:hypothetical protein SCMU_03490 [Corynebacterium cyclohexanicum]